MNKLLPLFLLLFSFLIDASAQCSFSVTASVDQDKICSPGAVVTLTGGTSATTISSESWTPAGAVNNSNAQVTTANVTATTLFTYEVTSRSDVNLITNGDFESGNTGFSSNYTYFPPTFNPAGFNGQSHTIITAPQIITNGFPACDDHTFANGTGTLMLVNSRLTTGVDVWCQTININPNSDYVFSMWVGGVLFLAPELDITVNGTSFGTANAFPGLCNWREFSNTWINPGGVTSIEICISVKNADIFGPIFGLDDISLNEICTDSDDVLVEVFDVESIIQPPSLINCIDDTAILDGTASTSGANITYEWTTPDGNISGATNQNQAIAESRGEYFLTVTYDDGTVTCSDIFSVIVDEDKIKPVAAAVVPNDLNCQNPTVQIDGSGSSHGSFTYDWSTIDGNITMGSGSDSPTVDLSGTYQLIVTDNVNGCKDTTDVFVDGFYDLPIADAGIGNDITCLMPNLQLDGSGSDQGANFTYNWSTIDGNIQSGSTSLMPSVNEPGTYEIEVTNTTNGCKETAIVTIGDTRDYPIADASTLDFLNCEVTEINLDGSGSTQDPGSTFEWSTQDGNIVSGINTLMPRVNSIGTYQILVTNALGCKDSTEVFADGDFFAPDVIIATPDSLKCGLSAIFLDGSASDFGGNYEYEWKTDNGNIVGTIDSTHAQVSSTGNYFLVITDDLNGCKDSSEVAVVGSGGFVNVVANVTDSITCQTPLITIDASNSSHDSIYKFSWRTDDGHFVSGDSTLTPVVDSGGIYWLTVIDTVNNCSDSLQIVVAENTTRPIIATSAPQTFLCSDDSVQVSAVVSNPDPNFLYQWGAVTGTINSGQFSLNPWVGSPGTFLIFAIDTSNGCQAVDTAKVLADTDLPVVQIATPDSLNCNVNSVQLDASGSDSGSNITFSWSTSDGNFSTAPLDYTPSVNGVGTYELLLQNTDNGCENIATIEVFENRDTPNVFVPIPDTINCADEQVILTSFVNGSATNLTFNWTTTNGSILGATSDISAVANEPGDYFLEVTDNATGCIRSIQTEVTEKKIFPDVTVALPDTINCRNPEIDLSASVSNTEGFFIFIWQEFPDGNIVGANNLPTIRVDSVGTYLVRAVETSTGCLSERLIDVEANFAYPQISVLPFDSLNCINDSVRIEGVAQSLGGNLSYSWTTPNGNILGATDDFSIIANQAGTYIWEVTDINSECVADTMITIGESRDLPIVQIALPDTLSCSLDPILLDANGSSNGNDFDINWTTSGGNIVSGANTLTPEINAPGMYYFSILNNTNGCTEMDSVQVTSNSSISGLTISLNGTDTLNCRQNQLEATVSPVPPGNPTFDWTGTLVSNSDPTSIVNAPGTITVEVTDTTGCKGQASIEIFSDFAEPTAEAGDPQQLSCSVDSLILSGSGSGSLGAIFNPTWTTTTGNIRSGENTFEPTVGTQGWYFLTVENTQNGCTKIDSVEITASTDLPFGFIEPAPVWNCLQQSFALDANTSDSGAGIEYSWTTSDGNIVSGTTGLMPMVDQPGTYFLEILNTNNTCKTTLSAEVVADTIRPDASAGIDTLINCFNPQISLNATVNSTRTDFRFEWQTAGGNIIQNADTNQPEIDAMGSYNLTVTDLINGCENTASVNVTEDFSKPVGAPLPTDDLTCSDTIVDLSVQLAGDDSDYEFIWTTSNGRFVNNADSSTVSADVGGDFQLEIIQLSNGCRDTVDLQVQESKQLPNISVNTSLSITCNDSTAPLSGAGSASGMGISYSWTTPDGQIISGQNDIDAVAGTEGTYTLTINDSNTGCKDTASVRVTLDTLRPTIVLTMPDTITCDQNGVIIAATVSGAITSNSTWTTNVGRIDSVINFEQILVSAPGFYFFSAENRDNGCEAQDSVEVFQNSSQPLAQIEAPEMLTCRQNEVQLDALNSTSGGQVSFGWTTASGNILSGAVGLNPIVDSAGIYVLTIRNIFTGCEGKDSVEVLAMPNTLTDLMLSGSNPGCDNPSGSIQIEEVFGGFEPFEFSIDNGANFSGENLFDNLPEGNYQITVRDSNGCVLNAAIDLVMSDSLVLSDLPDIKLTQGAERQIQVIANRDSADIELIEWSPSEGLSCDDCLTPTLTGKSTQTYTLLVRDVNGCEAMLEFLVETTAEIDVFFPSGFSPNNDSYNDLFNGYAAPGVISNIKTLQVFDRWGNKLYQGDNGDPSDATFGWDGTYKGQKMDPGVYIFFVELELFTGETVVMKGDVTIVGND